MRIAILTNAFPPKARGGAGQIAKTQADWWASHGHEVKIFTVEPFAKDDTSRHEVATFKALTTRKFADLGRSNALLRLLFHFEDLAPNPWAFDQVIEWHPDVLISHNLTGCGWGTPQLIQKSGVRWIHVLHDIQMFEPSGQRFYGEKYYGLKKMWRKFWAARRRLALGKPDVVVSPTRWLLEQHRSHGLFGGAACQVAPNPMPRLESAPARDGVAYLGRLSKDKGVECLLEAWDMLEDKPGRLLLVGDGHLRAQAERSAAIEVVGEQPHEQAMEALGKAAALVLPSVIMENQPTVLLEAVAMGKKVVASDVGGVRETLDGYGMLCVPNDPTALAKVLSKIPTLEVDAAVRERLLLRHDLDEVMQRLTSLLA